MIDNRSSFRLAAYVVAIVLAISVSSVNAQEGVPGEPFQFLQDQINELREELAELSPTNERVDNLEADVDKLKSGQFEEADLAGRYAMSIFAIDMGETPYVQTETFNGTLTLNDDADQTATLTGFGAHCRVEQGIGWFVACDPDATGSFEGEGFWELLPNGSLQLVDAFGNEGINSTNFIGAGGRVIIAGATGDFTNIPDRFPEIYSNIVVLIRLPDVE